MLNDVLITRFETPDEVRTFEKGRFEVVRLGSLTLGRATYQPGWKWSEHVGAANGAATCQVEHLGLVVAGAVAVSMPDGQVLEMSAGDIFHIPPDHDSWVVGDEEYVSLHFLGADDYAVSR